MPNPKTLKLEVHQSISSAHVESVTIKTELDSIEVQIALLPRDRHAQTLSSNQESPTLMPTGTEATESIDKREVEHHRHGYFKGRSLSGLHSLNNLLGDVLSHLDARSKGPSITGLAAGFVELDNLTSGMQRGNLVIIAGRPSAGKTTFALNVAEHIWNGLRLPTLIFSADLGGAQIVQRILGSAGNVDIGHLSTGRLDKNDWQCLDQALKRLHDAPVHIDDSVGLNAMDICWKAHRFNVMYGGCLGLVVIDDLQLLTPCPGGGNDDADRSETARELKKLAKEINVPIIAISKLSPELLKGTSERPVISDLGKSASIMHHADMILFVHRIDDDSLGDTDIGGAEIAIDRHRGGQTGTVKLRFNAQNCRFENY